MKEMIMYKFKKLSWMLSITLLLASTIIVSSCSETEEPGSSGILNQLDGAEASGVMSL